MLISSGRRPIARRRVHRVAYEDTTLLVSLPLEQNEQARANQIMFRPVKSLTVPKRSLGRPETINLGGCLRAGRMGRLDIDHGRSYVPRVTAPVPVSPPRRICFLLRIRRERAQEYRERHASVWPEMCDALRRAGWHNYSLFLDDDGLLVGYLECDDFTAAQAAMQKEEVNARWQAEMAPFFELADGTAPDAAMTPLPEIFHLD
jgi:L-rhamnose mutarotase